MKKIFPHIITVVSFVIFVVLGLASATGPRIGSGNASMLYFDANGGIGTVLDSQTVEKGASFTIPGGDGLSFGDATFVGWYSVSDLDNSITNYRVGESFTPPGGYITLYAKWELEADDFDSVTGFANKMAWLLNNASTGNTYNIELNANESIGTQTLFYPGKNNITITLRGSGGVRIISSAVNNRIFNVYSGVTLVLDNDITLQGNNNNSDVLVLVNGGRLRMNNNSNITENGGAGVHIRGHLENGNEVNGLFEMNGGTISRNRSNRNARVGTANVGGVNVGSLGIFTMSNGTISDNNGNGVFIWNDASFTMSGGSITGNTGSSTTQVRSGQSNISAGDGGGVRVYSSGSTFTMNNGNISGNTGGGVAVEGTFTMNGGTITGNTSRYRGGGVYVWERANFQRIGGTISGNTPNDVEIHPDNPNQ